MRITVGRKLWVGFSSILVFLILVGTISLLSTIRLNSDFTNLLDDQVKKVDILDELILKQNEIQSEVRAYMIFKDSWFLNKRIEHIERSEELMYDLEQMIGNEEMQNNYDALRESMNTFLSLQEEIVEVTELDRPAIANVLARGSNSVGKNVIERAQVIKDVQYETVTKTRSDLQSYMAFLKLFVIGIILFATIVGLIIASVIARSISKPVGIVTDGLNEIAAGNFAIDYLSVKNNDEIGDMAAAFNKMGADVASMMRKINASALELATQSEELSASSEESLASSEMVAKSAETQMLGSEQQQRIIGQSVSSMEELSLGVSEIATSNSEMLQSTETVSQLVSKGSDVINEVSTQMSIISLTIQESSEVMKEMAMHSKEIQNVTALITAISEQTNLLALNAAIEAARAGEYGKGFAVVAEEVRKLAEQSKRSAAEIKDMVTVIQTDTQKALESITSGNACVNEGIAATDESRIVFDEIESAVGVVAIKVETVSAAIEEIQAMADEVTHGSQEIQRLSEIATTTASDTSTATEEQLAVNEEISASAQSLAKLAEDLQIEMNKFKV